MSHLTYGIELWGSCTVTLMKPIEILQKRALRFIANKSYRQEIESNFKQFKLLKISDLAYLRTNILMYKAFHTSLPPNLQKLYKRNISERTRQSHLNLNVERKSNKIQNCRPSHQFLAHIYGI